MAYAYEKLISDKKINISDLPEEVEVAISEIKNAERGIEMARKQKEKKGEKFTVSASVTKKLKAMDTFAVRGIQDYLIGKEVEGEVETTAKEIVEQVKEENAPPATTEAKEETKEETPAAIPSADPAEIETELHGLFSSGSLVNSLDELKSKAPSCYKLIFEGYEAEADNGVQTSRFSLLETEKEKFTLTKK